MPENKGRYTVPRPILKVWYFFWYEVIMGIWLGVAAIRTQIFYRIEKLNYNVLPRHSGETAVLTGGTRGIGVQVLKRLLQLDYQVVFGVRSTDAGLKVIKNIRMEGVTSGTAKCIHLDLKSLKSVHEFAQNVLKDVDRIDLLINNVSVLILQENEFSLHNVLDSVAGVMLVPYDLTEDGYEVHFQVNHLSHFLLTQLLLPKMKLTASGKSTSCRIVNVSSIAHNISSAANIKDVTNPKVYSALRAYADSKLCQILFTKYQDSLLKSEDAGINIFALHPGAIITDLYVNVAFRRFCLFWMRMLYRRTVDDGAEVVMYAAISQELEGKGGLYIVNKQRCKPSQVTEDLVIQKSLWDLSHKCISEKYILSNS